MRRAMVLSARAMPRQASSVAVATAALLLTISTPSGMAAAHATPSSSLLSHVTGGAWVVVPGTDDAEGAACAGSHNPCVLNGTVGSVAECQQVRAGQFSRMFAQR
jgi:hypothetical protein